MGRWEEGEGKWEIVRFPRSIWFSGKESACQAGDARDIGSIPGLGRSLEEEMGMHSSKLAWEIPWTEEPGKLFWVAKVHRVAKGLTQLSN